MAADTREDLGFTAQILLRMMAGARGENRITFGTDFAARVRGVADAILDRAGRQGLVVRGIRTGGEGAAQLGCARGGAYRGVPVVASGSRRGSVVFVIARAWR